MVSYQQRDRVKQLSLQPGLPNAKRLPRIPAGSSPGPHLGAKKLDHVFGSELLNCFTNRWVQDLQSGLQSLRLDALGEAKLEYQEFSPGVFFSEYYFH